MASKDEGVNIPIDLEVNFNDADLTKNIQDLKKQVQDTFNKIDTSKMDKSMMNSIIRIRKLVAQLDTAKGKLDNISTSGATVDTSGMEKAQVKVSELEGKMNLAAKQAQSLQDYLDAGHPANYLINLESKLKKTQVEAAQASKEVETLQKKYDRAITRNASPVWVGNLKKQLDEAIVREGTLTDKAEELERTWVLLPSVVTETGGNIDAIEARMTELDEVTAGYYKRLQEIATYDVAGPEGNKWTVKPDDFTIPDTSSAKFNEQLINTQSIIGKIQIAMSELSNKTDQAMDTGKVSRWSAALSKVANIAKSVGSTAGNIGKGFISAGSKIGSLVKKIMSAKNALSKLRKGSNSTTSDMSKGFNKALKNVMQFGLGFRSLYFLIKRLRSTFIEAFESMAAQIPDINTQLSELITAFNQVKASLATAFQPLASVVIPLLKTFLVYVNQAMEAVGKFFAVLTGQGYIYKATAAQVDYAKSLGATASAAKKSLSPLDELNNLTSDSGSDSGSGTDLTATYDMSPVDVEGAISEFAEMVKKAWANSDFTDVGTYLGQKLLDALTIANETLWGPLQDFAQKIGTSLATLINGFIDVPNLGATIGTALGNAVNTGLILADSFFGNLEWDSLGEFLGNIINGTVAKIDWGLFGQMLFDRFYGELEFFASLIGTIDGSMIGNAIIELLHNIDWSAITEEFGLLGTNLATLINDTLNSSFSPRAGGLDTVSLGKELGGTIAGILNSRLEFLATFITTMDWAALGREAMVMVQTGFEDIDWGNLGTIFSGILSGIYDLVTGLIEGIDWKSLPMDIINAIIEFVQGVDFADLASSFAGLIGAALGAVVGLLDGIEQLVLNIADAIATAITDYYDQFEDLGDFLWNGVLMGIVNAIANIAQWIWDNVFTPFIEGFKSAFGIASPSTVMAEQGNFIMEGLFNGITALVDKVVEIFTTVKTKITEKITALRTKIAEVVTNIRTNWSTAWTNIKDTVVTIFTNIKTAISAKITEIKTAIANTINNIKTNWSNIWNSIRTVVTSIFTNIRTNISMYINSIKTAIANVLNSISSHWSNSWNNIKNTAINVFTALRNALRTPINGIISMVESLANGVISGINRMISALNGLHFSIPSWVPGLGGASFGFNIPTLSGISIPRLAQGAVIPPNKEFLAMLGDQKNGTNIEAPLDTIKQALAEVLAEANASGDTDGDFVFQIDGDTFFRITRKKAREYYVKTGKSAFAT